jgi:hypothetical protein
LLLDIWDSFEPFLTCGVEPLIYLSSPLISPHLQHFVISSPPLLSGELALISLFVVTIDWITPASPIHLSLFCAFNNVSFDKTTI